MPSVTRVRALVGAIIIEQSWHEFCDVRVKIAKRADSVTSKGFYLLHLRVRAFSYYSFESQGPPRECLHKRAS